MELEENKVSFKRSGERNGASDTSGTRGGLGESGAEVGCIIN